MSLRHRNGRWNTMNRLKDIRKAKKLTVNEVAKAIGITQPALTHIENGHRNPSIQVAFKLANFFGVSIEDLFPQFKNNMGSKKPVGV